METIKNAISETGSKLKTLTLIDLLLWSIPVMVIATFQLLGLPMTN